VSRGRQDIAVERDNGSDRSQMSDGPEDGPPGSHVRVDAGEKSDRTAEYDGSPRKEVEKRQASHCR